MQDCVPHWYSLCGFDIASLVNVAYGTYGSIKKNGVLLQAIVVNGHCVPLVCVGGQSGAGQLHELVIFSAQGN